MNNKEFQKELELLKSNSKLKASKAFQKEFEKRLENVDDNKIPNKYLGRDSEDYYRLSIVLQIEDELERSELMLYNQID